MTNEIKELYDAVVIGAGPAGMAAALSLKESGVNNILIIDRENFPGGILPQCIHSGFGLHKFSRELTGPEYADIFAEKVREARIPALFDSCVTDISVSGGIKKLLVFSAGHGILELAARAVILAMGCREKNRGNITIPGTRPAGVMTAGFAQKMVNMRGFLPGREIVILGSGDIGLIMARRLSLEGAKVKAVIEMQSFPGGLNRNIVQCLHDFDIPLFLSHTVSNIIGSKRITAVEVSPVEDRSGNPSKGSFILNCDTLLLSVGLVPENELSLRAGVKLDPVTRGPLTDSSLMTNIPGIFACGNVLHVHDLADYVSDEAGLCGKHAAEWLRGENRNLPQIPVKAGKMVRQAVPRQASPGRPLTLSLRCLSPLTDVFLNVTAGGVQLHRKKHRKIFPSNMQRLFLENIPADAASVDVFFSNEPISKVAFSEKSIVL
jgi:NADPH-dependent 2,4-dienoyl-CoA reductase/sulfur reductase-like enzyme